LEGEVIVVPTAIYHYYFIEFPNGLSADEYTIELHGKGSGKANPDGSGDLEITTTVIVV